MRRCLPFFLLLFLVLPDPAVAQEQYPEWREAFDVYVVDPAGGADRIIELGKKGTDGLPSSILTVLGDAYLRQGNYGSARRMFLRALEDPNALTDVGPGKASIASHAELGLALAAVGSGKLAEARKRFAAASGPGDMGYVATLGHAQTAIAMGRHDEGLELLAALSDAEDVEPSLLDAARFASANALLDGGDYEAAAAAFQAIADGSTGEMAVDASFAAAVARQRSGARDVALEELTALVEKCPKLEEGEERRKVSRADIALDPTAVLQSWVRNYREQSFADYRDGPGLALLLHGCDLAVETVAVYDEIAPIEVVAAAEPEPVEMPETSAAAVEGDTRPAADSSDAASGAATASSDSAGDGESASLWLVVLGVLVLAGVVWFWRRG